MRKLYIVLIIATLTFFESNQITIAQNNDDYTNDFKYSKKLNISTTTHQCYLSQNSKNEMIIIDSKTKKQIVEKIEPQLLSYTKNLYLGQIGEDVYDLKNALKLLGYKISKANYCFDTESRNAVLNFQKNNYISTDGIAGNVTINKINELLKMHNFSIPKQTVEIKEFPKNDYWIIINKSTNTLILSKGNKIEKKYPIATGRKWSYTPEGKFTIVNKKVNPAWGGGGYAQPVKGGISKNPLGYRWMGLDKGGGGIYGIHGTNNPYSIGTYASHGCIRMFNKDVEELFEIIPQDAPVWIGSTEKLELWGISYKYN